MRVIDTLAFLQSDFFETEPIGEDWQLIGSCGVTAINQTLDTRSWDGWIRNVLKFTRYFDEHPEIVTKILRSGDLERAEREGLLGVIFGSQMPEYVGKDLGLLEEAYHHGLRIQILAYNTRSYFGDGCAERTDAGLSYLGIEAIEKMNELGILVDCSHAGEQTALEAIQASRSPVAITHCNMKAVYDTPRNISDRLARACAQEGGVVGITWLSMFVGPEENCTVESLLHHICHLVDVAGIDHVSIGSDSLLLGYRRRYPDAETFHEHNREYIKRFNAPYLRYPCWIEPLDGPGAHAKLIGALEKGGFKAGEIEKIMGLNFFRLFKEVVG